MLKIGTANNSDKHLPRSQPLAGNAFPSALPKRKDRAFQYGFPVGDWEPEVYFTGGRAQATKEQRKALTAVWTFTELRSAHKRPHIGAWTGACGVLARRTSRAPLVATL